MKLKKIYISLNFILKMLFRRRIVMVLFFSIPIIFLGIVNFTTSDRILPFLLASMENEVYVEISEKEISLVFFAVAVTGFLCSFLALNLIQKNHETNRRLIICGYNPIELLLSSLLSLLIITVTIALYVTFLTNFFFEIKNMSFFAIALILSGFVYGCYGLAIGSLIKGELEGILFVVLLVNIDAGWLQNPLFYAEAQHQKLIQFLPAFYPSQSIIKAAFTDYSVRNTYIYSFLYGFLFLLFSMIIFYNKMKLKK